MADTFWDRAKDFAYRHAPEWVQQRVDDNRAIARVTESLRQDLVQSGEWQKPHGERTMPDAAWNSYTRYLDDVHKGKGLPAAWEAHQKRMGTHIEAAEPVQGDLWQQALQAGQAARAAEPEPAPALAATRQL